MVELNTITLLLASGFFSLLYTLGIAYKSNHKCLETVSFINTIIILLSSIVHMPYFIGLLVLFKITYNMI